MQAAAKPALEVATSLALDRTYLATERTLMGWIRTALSMITFGFTISKLGDVLAHVEIKGVWRVHTFSVRSLGELLVTFGTIVLGVACFQHRRRVKGLCALGFRHQTSLAYVAALTLAVVGVFALTALVMSL